MIIKIYALDIVNLILDLIIFAMCGFFHPIDDSAKTSYIMLFLWIITIVVDYLARLNIDRAYLDGQIENDWDKFEFWASIVLSSIAIILSADVNVNYFIRYVRGTVSYIFIVTTIIIIALLANDIRKYIIWTIRKD